METPVLIGRIAAPASSRRVGPPPTEKESGRTPAFADGLPDYATLAYLEKLGTVGLITLAFVYLIVRTIESGARAAIAEVGGKKL